MYENFTIQKFRSVKKIKFPNFRHLWTTPIHIWRKIKFFKDTIVEKKDRKMEKKNKSRIDRGDVHFQAWKANKKKLRLCMYDDSSKTIIIMMRKNI